MPLSTNVVDKGKKKREGREHHRLGPSFARRTSENSVKAKFAFWAFSEVRLAGVLRSSADPRSNIYERTGLRSAFLGVLSCLPHNLSDVFYRSLRSTPLAYLPARAVFEVPKPEVVPYEYESLLYCHPLSSQPVVDRKKCFGADIATQTLGGFFVSDGRRGILHASGYRVVPMHEKSPFLLKAHLKGYLRGSVNRRVAHVSRHDRKAVESL